MNLPYDTTIHYRAIHEHPYSEYVELKDITTDQTVYRGNAKNFKEKIGLDSVDFYASEKGIPVYKDHEYELITVYNNPTNKLVDAMSFIQIYLLDKGFVHPEQ